ncbi:universal stress protein [Rhizobium rhizoryzae]|uniref:Universal stress protein n=1 Tax=Rhizobium rhizoryzae TaxID=451876 RepID=A0A7W6LGG2_9HYPH|nr:universal stress protein [Rhizobium rhizoryzae]MBB4142792.1 nucleotide-binding universal stress UspA family protein [Rhizobium rhizoryzae]
MYASIVVAIDIAQLDRGEQILKKAVALLDQGGKIALINVVEELPSYLAIDVPTDLLGSARQEATAKLQDLRERVGTSASIDVRTGAPAHEILAAAQAYSADLIVLASHKPDFSNYLIGATADRVVRHAKCSVLVDR